MKKNVIGVAVIIFAFVGTLVAWTDDPSDADALIGDWYNQLAKPSTLKIMSIDNATGIFKGAYHEGSTGTDEPVVGWVNSAPAVQGDNVRVLSFTVRWSKYGSITSWTGYLRDEPKTGVPTLYMQWNLARASSSFDWDHVIANQDRFTKAAAGPDKKK